MHHEAGSSSRALHPALARIPGHLMWRAAARVTVALEDVLPPGVDLHSYAALLALSDGVARSQQAVADAVGISRTTMARVAGDQVAAGLVERVRNPDDRRSYALTRTPAGAAAAHDWQRHADDLQDRLLATLEPDERTDLLRLLLAVLGNELAPETPEPLRTSIGFLITRTHFHLHREFLEALGPVGIEPRMVGALTALTATGPIAQAELARLLGTSGASVVQIADSLEHRGLVERRRDPEDRRTQLLHLLPEASVVRRRARRIADGIIAEWFRPLTEDDVERLVALLREFVTAP